MFRPCAQPMTKTGQMVIKKAEVAGLAASDLLMNPLYAHDAHHPLLSGELMARRLIERMGAYQRDGKAIWMALPDAV